MTPHPLPTTGGSYIRHQDGSLELIEGSHTAPADLSMEEPAPAPAAPEPPAQSGRKGAVKAPLKE